MRKCFNYSLFLLMSLWIFIGCQHKPPTPVPQQPAQGSNDTTGGNNNGGNTVDTGICFTRDILPIFISNCAKSACHDAVTKSDGYQFTDYNSIVSKDFVPGNADATELYEKITEDKPDKIMPPPPANALTAEQRDLIRRWINEGAKNTTNCSTPCDTNKFAFAADIQPIMDKYCKGCHSGTSAPLGIVLDSYSGVVAAANSGRLIGVIKHEAGFAPMPQGGNKLSDCEVIKIEKWIGSGKQNN